MNTMNSSFSQTFAERRTGLLGGLPYGIAHSGGHAEHLHKTPRLYPGREPLAHPVPLLIYPTNVDAGLYEGSYRGAPPLFPYLPAFHGHFGVYECPFEPAFIQKRNERERQRVKCVNQGYAKLRDHLPGGTRDKRLSKVETLRAAIQYIKHLQGLVGQPAQAEGSLSRPTQRRPAESGHSDEESASSPGLYCEESEGSGS